MSLEASRKLRPTGTKVSPGRAEAEGEGKARRERVRLPTGSDQPRGSPASLPRPAPPIGRRGRSLYPESPEGQVEAG